MALALYNTTSMRRIDGGLDALDPYHAMVKDAAERFFAHPGVSDEPFGFIWDIVGEIPISRGLGSSVTLRLGIIGGLNELCSSPLSVDDIFRLCADAEGHPDNAGPGAFGGFVLANRRGDSFRFEVPDRLSTVLLIPDFEVMTDPSREALPMSIPLTDAVVNLGNACTIAAAFATGQLEKLRGAFDDRLHQPYRKVLVPGLMEIIDAGTKAGAVGGFLSGSGSTIACFTHEENGDEIAAAMRSAHPETGTRSETLILKADNAGMQVL